MKFVYVISVLVLLIACNNSTTIQTTNSNAKIDSLQRQLDDCYKPGFGELMGKIQYHHNKLNFAGKSKNWQLAEFEIHEIIESLEDIEKYQSNRSESKSIGMMKPALDSLVVSIEQKNEISFNHQYNNLTNTCNNCHNTTGYNFIKIKVSTTSNVTNQEF